MTRKRKRPSPHYPGTIHYQQIALPNREPAEMREIVMSLPFLGYHVETLSDGRKICITKPGGKRAYDNLKIGDFMVWIYDEVEADRWRISHAEIYDDICGKIEANLLLAAKFVGLMLRVCEGAEPEDVLREVPPQLATLPGLSLELVLKTYKWIWVEEDCNYPGKEGRWMSMKPLIDLFAL